MTMSWNDYLATLPEAQRKCWEGPGHCEHLEHSTCCLCGYVTKECADPECDATAYLGSDYCADDQPEAEPVLPKCAKCGRTPRGGILDDDGTGRLVCWQATSDESWPECYPPEACL